MTSDLTTSLNVYSTGQSAYVLNVLRDTKHPGGFTPFISGSLKKTLGDLSLFYVFPLVRHRRRWSERFNTV